MHVLYLSSVSKAAAALAEALAAQPLPREASARTLLSWVSYLVKAEQMLRQRQ